jgi:hypothetical protein
VVTEAAPTFVVDPLSLPVIMLSDSATAHYGGTGFVITAALLDSQDVGTDGWKSCAKLTRAQFGIADGTPAQFLSQNDKFCAEDPDGFVLKVLIAAPEQTAFLPIEFNGEKLEVLSVTTVTAGTPLRITTPPTDPVVADGAK